MSTPADATPEPIDAAAAQKSAAQPARASRSGAARAREKTPKADKPETVAARKTRASAASPGSARSKRPSPAPGRAAAARPPRPAVSAETIAAIDTELDALRIGSAVWSTLTLTQRATLLRRLHASVSAAAEDWARIAAETKGLDARHPLRGEEWLSGPYAVLSALSTYERTLRTLAAGGSPLDGKKFSTSPSGRTRVDVFPADGVDATLLSGFTGQVWLRPGVDAGQAIRGAGLAQLTPGASGGVGLVLGAGNITSIPVLDVLYELLSANRVSLLKLNPTQDRLLPVYRRALLPLVEAGFVRIISGDGAVGAHLTASDAFAHVHITGSAVTFDAIVWGTGAAAEKRRKNGQPLLHKPITGELGGVAPIIVVPGEWTQADLDYQAEHVVTMRLQNCGHNCISGQVVILSADWPQREDFLDALRRAYAAAPDRPVWYPNSASKLGAADDAYPAAERFGERRLIVLDDADDARALESTEYFSPVLGVVTLPGTGQHFLDAAVAHANEKLAGTLGANVLIDPSAQRALGAGFDRAIDDLHYGNIAINGWTGFSFTAPTLSWGAFPGHTLSDVGSGIGVVHNGLLIDHVERSVLSGPFRPFPRSLGGGAWTILPKPPWFVTSRTGAQVSEGFTRFRMDGNIPRLMKTLLQALRS
ncbi:aldehyde dehydrogenase family protein [Microbacterium nymphoidis]|uniref:aldehyde dehydrogenase family protein n=1 Tax=Microbacterium nymphoidis TaxID=2898586 RepID=UPI001E33CEF3|nr:aldehyde dehydrogenase family protein [Microbacterium nymphoidis]MCD2499675.1 aldehyde dehydrogenase family protein [Microbacterium nymphoidis]